MGLVVFRNLLCFFVVFPDHPDQLKNLYTYRLLPPCACFALHGAAVCLHGRGQHGDQGEVPVSVFQRSVVRLFRLMKMDRQVAASGHGDGNIHCGWGKNISMVPW